MPVNIPQVSVANGHNFAYLIDRVNDNSNAMSNVVVSVGSTATGDTGITGTFTSNSSIANTANLNYITANTVNASSISISGTDGLKIPVGTVSQRPSANTTGYIRYNSDINAFEGSGANTWTVIAQVGSNSSIFSSILTPTINFESSANNSLYYSSNTLYTKVGNNIVQTTNSSAVSISGEIVIANSTQSITISPPSLIQSSNGNYYLNANGSYNLVVSQPAGANTQVQFNDSGAFAGSAAVTFNKTSNTLYVSNTVSAPAFTGLTFSGQANTVTNISNTQILTALGGAVAYANGSNATGIWPISVTGNANTVSNGVYTNSSYANPGWLTSISGSIVSGNISGNATNITHYTINQNLSSTSTPTFAGLTSTGTITGNVTGNLTGNVVGSVSGNVTGNVTGTSLNITQYVINQNLGVGYQPTFNGAIITNDLYVYRSYAPNTGVLYLNNAANRYLNYDGTQYNMVGANLYVGGAGLFSGNIVAYYSDLRLKDVLGPIDNAISKVNQLTGIYYKNNSTAIEYGFDSNEQQVGLIAQDVQKVVPEAVKPAPFDTDKDGNSISGENYITVQYDKLVPLLIEAIKEQQKQIDILEARISNIVSM